MTFNIQKGEKNGFKRCKMEMMSREWAEVKSENKLSGESSLWNEISVEKKLLLWCLAV